MPKQIIIRGRKVVGGVAEGEAIVSHEPVEGWINADYQRGIITERGHPLRGIKLKDKVFVFPAPKGSGGWIRSFGWMPRYNVAPAAMLFMRGNCLTFQGAVLGNIPSMTDFDKDPVEIIETGDHVKVDADKGIVYVIKK